MPGGATESLEWLHLFCIVLDDTILDVACLDVSLLDEPSLDDTILRYSRAAILDDTVLDSASLDVSLLDALNAPKKADFGCYLEVLIAGCCGSGCCVFWMLRSWML